MQRDRTCVALRTKVPKTRGVQLLRLLPLITLATLVAGCGGSGRGSILNQPATPNTPTQPSQPTTPTPPQVATTIDASPGAVLLTSVSATRTLQAVVRDAQGATMQTTVVWSSSDPAVVTVDSAGVVRPIAATGTARITAAVGSLQSAPVYVSIALPVTGAVLVSDNQIVGRPTLSTVQPAIGNHYEAVLRGIPAPTVGAILIGTEAISVGGRVVSTQAEGGDTRVRLVMVPPDEMFDSFDFNDTIDLTQGTLEVPAELAALYTVQRNGLEFTFTPKPSQALAITQQKPSGLATVMQASAPPTGTRALPALPPFKSCEAVLELGSDEFGAEIPLSLSAEPAFKITLAGTANLRATDEMTSVALRGTPKFTISSVLEVKSAFNAKVGCKLTLVRRKYRAPGWAGLLFGGDVEFGVGFEVGGEVTLARAKVGGTLEISPTIDAALRCPQQGSCSLTGNVTAQSALSPKLEAPSLTNLNFKPGVKLYGFASLEAGNADLEQLQFEALEIKAGPELGASLTFEALQIDNPSPDEGRSKYALDFKAKIGPGVKLGEFFNYVGLDKVVPLELAFEHPLGESPKGTVSADAVKYAPGERATITVKLDPTTTVFPAGSTFYNVDRVVIVHKTDTFTTAAFASQTATDGQTDFTISFNTPSPGSVINSKDLYAFIVTRLLPLDPPKLEIAGAKAPVASPLAGGRHYTCLIVADGTVRCWGFGPLGDGTGITFRSETPVAVSGLSSVVAIATGDAHACALLASGSVMCWGSNNFAQLGNGTTTDPVVAGDGTLIDSAVPVAVTGIDSAVAIAAGELHTCALLADGTMRCWGYNNTGAYGNGNRRTSRMPVPVPGLASVSAIAAGSNHTCAVIQDGSMRCWGTNDMGALGTGDIFLTHSLTPVAVTGITSAVAVTAGERNTCALLADSTLRCWGNNDWGQLGAGTPISDELTDYSATPVAVAGITTAVAAAISGHHACAQLADGTISCWGANFEGQLGQPLSVRSNVVPLTVAGVTPISGLAVGRGSNCHTCAQLTDRTVRCWGTNASGQLGTGSLAGGGPTPVQVIGLPR